MSNIHDARKAQRSREYFIEASRPFYVQMARIHAIYDQPRMMVDAAGTVTVLEPTLPEFAQQWIAQCEEGIEACLKLAERAGEVP